MKIACPVYGIEETLQEETVTGYNIMQDAKIEKEAIHIVNWN